MSESVAKFRLLMAEFDNVVESAGQLNDTVFERAACGADRRPYSLVLLNLDKVISPSIHLSWYTWFTW